MESIGGRILGWAISLLILCLIVGLLFWFISNPTTAANFIVNVIGGLFRFATSLINGIAGLLT